MREPGWYRGRKFWNYSLVPELGRDFLILDTQIYPLFLGFNNL